MQPPVTPAEEQLPRQEVLAEDMPIRSCAEPPAKVQRTLLTQSRTQLSTMSAPLCREGDPLFHDPPDGWDGSEAVPASFRNNVHYRKLRGVLSVESSKEKPFKTSLKDTLFLVHYFLIKTRICTVYVCLMQVWVNPGEQVNGPQGLRTTV